MKDGLANVLLSIKDMIVTTILIVFSSIEISINLILQGETSKRIIKSSIILSFTYLVMLLFVVRIRGVIILLLTTWGLTILYSILNQESDTILEDIKNIVFSFRKRGNDDTQGDEYEEGYAEDEYDDDEGYGEGNDKRGKYDSEGEEDVDDYYEEDYEEEYKGKCDNHGELNEGHKEPTEDIQEISLDELVSTRRKPKVDMLEIDQINDTQPDIHEDDNEMSDNEKRYNNISGASSYSQEDEERTTNEGYRRISHSMFAHTIEDLDEIDYDDEETVMQEMNNNNVNQPTFPTTERKRTGSRLQ